MSYSYFDPLAPQQTSRAPITFGQNNVFIPHPPIVPNYDQIKATLPPRLPSTAPPRVVSSLTPGDVSPVPSRTPLATTPALGFEGIPQTIYQPPSSNIAAGPKDVIQIVNSTVARYDKNGQMTNTTLLSQWFSDFIPTVCSSGNFGNCILGDVSIRYDQLHGRFLMTLQGLDTTNQTSYLMMSVSSGATFDSGWKNWVLNAKYDGTTLGSNWCDFPQPGFDNDAVYVSCNMFTFSNFVFQYAKVRIFKKTELYNPTTTTLTYQDIFNLKNEDGTVASTLEVPQLRGRPLVQTATGVMVNASDTPQADYLTLWRINSPLSSAPTVTRTTLRGIWKYSYPASAPQLNSNVVFDTGPSSIGKVIQRDGKLYTARNTGYTDEPTTVTYDVIDLNSAKVLQQSRWVNGNFFYPAFDVPATMGPGQDLPNKLIVGTTTSSAGALTFAGLTGMKDGQDVFDLTSSGNKARWGDYNGAGIDPVTGGLWVSGEYAKTKNLGVSTYGTWNSFFPWGSSQTFDDVPSTNVDFNYLNVMKLWNITKGCSSTPSLYCPNDTATRETIAVFLIRSLYGDTFTYTNSPYFTDVPSTSPSFPYIQKMKDLGITLGCSPTLYCPATAATREMAAVFIIRAKMKNLFPSDNFPYPSTAYFTDVASTNSNFSFIQKFRDMGITQGCSPTLYCPTQPLTREQLGVFIVRAFFN